MLLLSSALTQGPSSICTSTRSILRVGAQATPATATRPALTLAPRRGTSMRDCVLMGPRLAQPRGTQYESNPSQVVRRISSSHFVADT